MENNQIYKMERQQVRKWRQQKYGNAPNSAGK